MGTRGVWSLENVEVKKPQDDWVNIPSVWIGENQNVGYTKFYNQFQYKLNFSTNSATVTTHLPTTEIQQAGTSSATAAYFIAGEPGPISDATKITYATDTSADTPSARFHIPINAVGALAGKDHSYLFGGIPSGSTYANKLTFANDTTVNSPSSYLEGARYNVQSGTAGGADGYVFAGGTSGYSITQKIAFVNDTRSTLPSSSNMKSYNENPTYGNILPYWGAGKMQCSTHCYYGGGNPGGANYTSSFQKLTFSNETWAVNPSKMARELRYVGGFTASPTQGAIAGGAIAPYGSGSSSVDFVTFANDTWATSPSMTLPATPGGPAGAYYNQVAATTIHDSLHSGTPGLPMINERFVDGAAESPNYGYSIAGRAEFSPAYSDKAHKIDFSNDTPSTSPSLDYYLSTRYCFGAGNQTQGYVMGGTDGSPSDGESQVMKVTYATETKSDLAGAMAARRYGSFAMTNGGNTKMFVLGGRNPTVNTGRQMDLATETWSDIPSDGYLSYPKYRGASAATPTHGYAMMGSFDPGPQIRSHADKIEFSTYTTSGLPSVFPQEAEGNSGLSESTAAYSMGGKKTPSADMTIIQKLTFATDTGEALSQTLSSVRYWTQTMGKDTQGYVAGGAHYGPSNTEWHSFVDKFVYATSTISATPNLPDEQACGTGISAGSDNIPFYKAPTATPTASTYLAYPSSISDNGYLGGGWVSGNSGGSPSVYKINMTTETLSTPSGLPGFYRAGSGKAISSPSNAYFAGGPNGTGPAGSLGKSTVRKISYSSDSETSAPNMQKGVHSAFAFGNTTHGFILGGSSSEYTPYEATSFNQKITYSTESWATSTYPAGGIGQAGSWHIQRSESATGGTSEYGYIGPANENWAASNVVKYTYATDVATIVPGYDQDGGWRKAIRQVGLNSPTHWYLVAGMEPAVGEMSSVAKMSFATETVTNDALNMNSIEGEYASGLDNPEKGFGLVHRMSLANKLTFATDTSSNAGYTVPNPSPGNKYQQGGTSQKDFGVNTTSTPYVI